MRYYIITGTSRGIGQALAREIIIRGKGNTLFCISRGGSDELARESREDGAIVHDIIFDLSKTHEIDVLIDRIFRGIDPGNCQELVLVNNAGVLEPIGPAGFNSTAAVEHHIRTNLLAPMRLTSLTIARARQMHMRGKKSIIAITSGAASHPYHGWSAYCTGKAGLEMFIRTVGLEQLKEEDPFSLVSVWPGIIETRMQELIRRSDPEHFADRDKFIHYRDAGLLDKPEDTARNLLKLIDQREWENGESVDLRARIEKERS